MCIRDVSLYRKQYYTAANCLLSSLDSEMSVT